MFFLILSEINTGIYSSIPSGNFYHFTPVGIQFEFFLGKRYIFTSISYYNYNSKSYRLSILENGYGVYFDFVGFKTGISLSYNYYYRKSKLSGFEDGFTGFFSLFIRKYFISDNKFISVNFKMSEVFNDFGFDIYNIGISFGLQ